MITGRNNLIEWFNSNGKPYFSIFRKINIENGNTVFSNRDKEDQTMETAAAKLNQYLALIHSGEFFIYATSDPKATSKGRSETYFSLSSSEIASQATQQPQIAGFGAPAMDYNQMLVEADKRAEDRFSRMMIDHQLKELKEKTAILEKENKELQKQADQPFNKFLGEVSPYIGSIVQNIFPGARAAQLPISGTPHDETITPHTEPGEAVSEEISGAVNAFCDALAERYPAEWLAIIQKLTNTIKTAPEKIDMALKFL